MPKIEVEEEDYLRGNRVIGELRKIASHPKAKMLLQEAHKLADPNAPTPELDAQKPVMDALEATRKELADFKKAVEDKETERERVSKLSALEQQIERGLSNLRSDGWTDDGIKAVRELMETKGITDPAIAAAYHEKMHPPATPTMPTGSSGPWNFLEMPQEDDFTKKLLETHGQVDPLVDRKAREVLSEMHGTPVRR